jgi:sec-independent protein translocase protein TatC
LSTGTSFTIGGTPLFQVLRELRKRLLFVALAWLAAFLTAWPLREYIMAFVELPLSPYTKLTFDTLTAPFMTHFKASAYAALFVTLPLIMLQAWLLLRRRLTGRERRLIWPFLLLSYPLFVGGALFCYWLVFPVAVKFFVEFDRTIVPSLRVDEYLTFTLRLLVVFGLVFEMPLVSLLLTRAGLLTPEFLSRNRRYAIVLLFMGAAVLTPPDVLSMMMLAMPLILLYEISILVARISRPRRPPGAA